MLEIGDWVVIPNQHKITQILHTGSTVSYLVEFTGGGKCYLEEGQLCKVVEPLERDGKDILREQQESEGESE